MHEIELLQAEEQREEIVSLRLYTCAKACSSHNVTTASLQRSKPVRTCCVMPTEIPMQKAQPVQLVQPFSLRIGSVGELSGDKTRAVRASGV